MSQINPQVIIDRSGRKTGVVLTPEAFDMLLSTIEELEDIRDYDVGINSDDWISLEEVEKQLSEQDYI